jgi:quercetin dioxygenase-like cupin family protein
MLAALTALPILAAPSQAAEPKYWRDGKNVPAVPYAAWEAGGKVTVVTGDEVKKAPANAVKYTVKTVKWPNATVKVLEFTKAGGGVLYNLTDETHFLVYKGSLQANVNGTPTDIKAKEVGAGLSGTLRNSGAAEDTLVVAYVISAPSTEDYKPAMVREENAFYGARGAATSPSANRKPDDTIVRRYVFPGNSLRLAQMFPNKISPPNTGSMDNYIYIFEGHVQYKQGGETYQAYAGDFLHQESGTIHEWDQKEGARFVASSSLPVGKTERMDPSKIN